MPGGSRRKQKHKHGRAAAMPSSSSTAAALPRHLRRPAAAAFAGALLLVVAYATWRGTAPPRALLRRPPPVRPAAARFYSFDVVREYPHDPDAFTQGLLYGGNDTLLESTGLYHRSSVREVDLQTGKVLVQHEMEGSLFGEGLTLVGERLFQVTWLKHDGFIYDRHNFSKRESFSHQMHDGWGLATDGKVLFGSDGSSKLYKIDPQTFKVIKTVTVKYNDKEVPYLNELEYINGEVWANIWETDCIARISHEDGLVVGWVLLHELRQHLTSSSYAAIDVLNGIAWDEEKGRLFVTGKLWPKLYEIKVHPVDGPPDGSIENLCPKASFYR